MARERDLVAQRPAWRRVRRGCLAVVSVLSIARACRPAGARARGSLFPSLPRSDEGGHAPRGPATPSKMVAPAEAGRQAAHPRAPARRLRPKPVGTAPENGPVGLD
eukprot:364189-Chlamydomonas_euryale.AAC.33